MTTYNEKMQAMYRQFQAEEGVEGPMTLDRIGTWAIAQGLWAPRPRDILRQFIAEMGKALRDEFYTDPQGRRVRTKHSVRIQKKEKGEQLVLWEWDDIRTTSRKHMQTSAQQRRQGVVADCNHLKTDVDSFNENRSPDDPIKLSFDFRADLAELEAERELLTASG